ncbi:hypothetical protein BpHYR1_007301 [Brachionus plicatilis]|uniref:Uncharacterized protein n=1 Tax=Brachionus plicatilis TaxID=10195 RepID=A0A3M7Q171_BRAPC|nr:hypothetical protein BpHYR1_007301 [Brachionus plicatilis]
MFVSENELRHGKDEDNEARLFQQIFSSSTLRAIFLIRLSKGKGLLLNHHVIIQWGCKYYDPSVCWLYDYVTDDN